MISNVAGVIIFLAIFGIVASNPDGGVDCRKFVFAPLCRGVAAKRDHSNPGHNEPGDFVNDESDRHLLGSLRAAMDILEKDADDNQIRIPPSRQNKIENLIKMYQQEQTGRILKLLFGNKGSNSERDNFPGQDFETL